MPPRFQKADITHVKSQPVINPHTPDRSALSTSPSLPRSILIWSRVTSVSLMAGALYWLVAWNANNIICPSITKIPYWRGWGFQLLHIQLQVSHIKNAKDRDISTADNLF